MVFSDVDRVYHIEPESMEDDQTANGSPPHTVTAPPPMRRPTMGRRQTTRPVFFSFPNSPTQGNLELPIEDEDVWGREPTSPITTAPTSSRFQTIARRTKNKIVNALIVLNEFMTVPMWAAIASLIVACVQPFQHALDQHMQPVKGSLAAAGNCSIPVTLIVLGAYFYTPSEEPTSDDPLLPNVQSNRHSDIEETERSRHWSSSTLSVATLTGSLRSAFKLSASKLPGVGSSPKKASERPGETKTVLVAILSRMVLTPLVLLPFVAGLAVFDLHKIMEE